MWSGKAKLVKVEQFVKCFLTLVRRSLFLRRFCFSFLWVFSAGHRRDENKNSIVTFKSSILEKNTSRIRVQGFETTFRCMNKNKTRHFVGLYSEITWKCFSSVGNWTHFTADNTNNRGQQRNIRHEEIRHPRSVLVLESWRKLKLWISEIGEPLSVAHQRDLPPPSASCQFHSGAASARQTDRTSRALAPGSATNDDEDIYILSVWLMLISSSDLQWAGTWGHGPTLCESPGRLCSTIWAATACFTEHHTFEYQYGTKRRPH